MTFKNKAIKIPDVLNIGGVMPSELGFYVIAAYLVFWILIGLGGVYLEMQKREKDRHQS